MGKECPSCLWTVDMTRNLKGICFYCCGRSISFHCHARLQFGVSSSDCIRSFSFFIQLYLLKHIFESCSKFYATVVYGFDGLHYFIPFSFVLSHIYEIESYHIFLSIEGLRCSKKWKLSDKYEPHHWNAAKNWFLPN